MSTDLDRLSAEGDAVFSWFSRLWFFKQLEQDMTLDELSNGHRIWEALQVINPEYFRGDLPEAAQSAGRWVNNLQNLKRIYTPLRHYVIEATKDSMPEGPGDIDIKAIAEGTHDEEIIKVLEWVLISAVNSDGNAPFIAEIGEMPHELQAHLANVINAFTSGSNKPQPRPDGFDLVPSSPAKAPLDNDLYNEQMYGDLAAKNSRLEKEKKDLQRELRILEQRNDRLKYNNDELVRELGDAQDKAKKSSAELDGQQSIKVLEARLQEANGWIDDIEKKHAEAQATISQMQSSESQLRKENEKLQPLLDSIDTLKKERETLSRRANMVDKLKQKLQDQQDLLNEIEDLRREVDELRSASPEVDTSRQRNIMLERQLMELQSTVSSNEVALVEANTFRQNLDRNNRELIDQLEAAKRKHEEDQEIIANLEARADEASLNITGLDQELEDSVRSDGKESTHGEDFTDQKLTRAPSTSGAQYRALQFLFDEQKEKYLDLEKRYFETYKTKLELEGALKSSESFEMSGLLPEFAAETADKRISSDLYISTKDKLHKRELEVVELQREKTAFRHKLTEAEKTIGLIDKGKVEALEQLKEINSQDFREKDTYIATLENKNKNLVSQLDEHRTMLSQTLMARHQNEVDGLPEERRNTQLENNELHFKELLEDISKSREELAKKEQVHEHLLSNIFEDVVLSPVREDKKNQPAFQIRKLKKLQDRNQEISDLRALLQQEKERTAPDILKATAQAALKQELDNVKRENKLMSTAYFDLSNRLQMNNVSLQRRTEAPRSFLNKQRALVNQATAVRTR